MRNIGNTSLNRLTLAILGSLAVGTSYAADLPTNGSVKFGSGTISQPTSQQMQINQTSDKLAIEWQSFNIAEGNKVNFQQPNSKSITLNRVVGTEGSKVMGQLNANGRVFLVNPNGVLFGNNAQVNVGGLVASTQDLTTNNFALGKYNFSGGNSPASVVNQGTITAKDGGAVVLLGGQVSNQGNIQANLGSVKLAAGKATTLDFGGDGLVNIQVTSAAANALAENSGLIQADGGQVVMSAAYANNNVLQTVVNNTGTLQAQTLSNKSGKIVLSGGQQGRVNVEGILDASTADQGNGGSIETSGQAVNVVASTSVDTRGIAGQNGTWTVAADHLDVNDGTGSSKVSARVVTNTLRTSNVELISNSSDLTIDNDISWNNGNQLLLAAQDNIVLNANLKATGKNAGLALIESGDYLLAKGKSVTLSGQGASFSNNGQSYTVIQNVNQLQAIQDDLTGHYVLGNTIDASDTAQWNEGKGFMPIGWGSTYWARLPEDDGVYFSGIFSGLGNTINQLTINQSSSNPQGTFSRFTGLFGGASGEIRNVGLTNAHLTVSMAPGLIAPSECDYYCYHNPTRDYVGGLVAYQSGGSIHDAYVENITINNLIVDVYRYANSGGMIGMARNTALNNLSASGKVTADGAVGGLIGGMFGTSLSHSSASTEVIHKDASFYYRYGGGLVGDVLSSSSIMDSYATGKVTAESAAGGLVGSLSGSILSGVWASGDVIGKFCIGGLVGCTMTSSITDAYASGNVSGGGRVGGLLGDLDRSSLSNSKASGNVSASGAIGGLVGELHNNSEVVYSSASGDVTHIGPEGPTSMTGTLAGSSLDSKIIKSFATGSVIGGQDAGKLVGYLDYNSTIEN
ncbi:two-partner secretion domain-containing protein [Serratia aquatilis]|uniref:Filamentous hemagglutinin N-terminal domain-containing protein n=1 Tax=Serratia aquatilis TaxID=1737515 RepID=A0ABV6EKF0_9GAMM